METSPKGPFQRTKNPLILNLLKRKIDWCSLPERELYEKRYLQHSAKQSKKCLIGALHPSMSFMKKEVFAAQCQAKKKVHHEIRDRSSSALFWSVDVMKKENYRIS